MCIALSWTMLAALPSEISAANESAAAAPTGELVASSGAVWADEVGSAYIFSRGNERQEPEPLRSVPCSQAEEGPHVRFVFPLQGYRLDALTDLSLGRTLLVRMRVGNFRLNIEGRVALTLEGYQLADLRGQGGGGASQSTGLSVRRTHLVGEPNVEIFGLTEGRYVLQAALVDARSVGRDCWKGETISFTVESHTYQNRSGSLLAGMRSHRRSGGRGQSSRQRRPFFMQPKKHSDFGYVTVFWGEKYLDNVIAWSAGLRAVGSSFPIYCLVVPEMLWEGYAEVLRACCCEVIGVEPIRWEGSPEKTSRYDLVLTKLRAYQLGARGLKKVVLMDADMLVLQNIDELFWLPAPSASPLHGTFLGDSAEPKMSAGVLVIEPSEAEFHSIMRTVSMYQESSGGEWGSEFFEQDMLDLHWARTRPGVPFNMLPLTYNLDPRMLDVMPFLSPHDISEKLHADFPLDHGVKAVHLWNWYNPMLATTGSARQSLQLSARLKHRVLWHWYELWWRLHQDGLQRGLPKEFPIWRDHCLQHNTRRYGSEIASKFVPVLLGGGGQCLHSQSGLAW